jgi:hypothetical protein
MKLAAAANFIDRAHSLMIWKKYLLCMSAPLDGSS